MNIFFDMDGVLADFEASVRMIPGYTPGLNKSSKNMSYQERIAKAKNFLAIEKIPAFWADMQPVLNINMLLDYAQSRGDMFVLTRIPKAEYFKNADRYIQEIANAKKQWIKDNMSRYFYPHSVIVCQGNKGELIKPTYKDVLIDDRPDNIADWCEAGGQGILFKSSIDALQQLQHIKVM